MQKNIVFASGGLFYPFHAHSRNKWRFLMRINLVCGILLALAINLLGATETSGQSIYKKQVALALHNVPLKSALLELEEASGMPIFFPSEVVDRYTAVHLGGRKRTVAEALELLLQGTPLSYRQRDGNIILAVEGAENLVKVNGQQVVQPGVRVSGIVVDEQAQPIPGVTVVIKDWKQQAPNFQGSTATDANGHFGINVPDERTVLIFSLLGHQTQEVIVGAQRRPEIVLVEDAETLEEVVITGLFERPKEMYTGAARSFNQEELQQVASNNVLTALKSLDPSFQMPENLNFGSDPNVLPDVTLRGGNSLVDPSGSSASPFNYENNPNTPLFVLDGFEVALSRINDLDLTRIKSVDILKDATATSIYGSRAANGVIIIETVRPQPGEFRVTYNGNVTFEAPDLSDYNLLDAEGKVAIEEAANVYRHSWNLWDQQLAYYHSQRKADILRGVNTDWMALPLRNGVGQRHNMYVEGGNEAVLYGVGAVFASTSGAMKGSDRQTFTGNSFLSYRTDKLNIRNEVLITSNVGNSSPYGSFRQYARLNPYWTPYDNDGSLKYYLEAAYDENGNRLTRFDQYDNLDGTVPGRPTNPLYNADLDLIDQTRYTNVTNNTAFEWKAKPWLRFNGSLALQFQWDESDRFLPAQHTSFAATPTFDRGSYDKGHGKKTNYDINLAANFNKSINKHLLFATLGTNVQQVRSFINEYTVVGFPNARLDDVTQGLKFAEDSRVTGEETYTRLFGLFANASYAYDNRFLLDFSYRLDGSSQFGANNRIAPFWSAGAGWNLHNEAVFDDADWLDLFKLRYSFGYTGSQSFDSYLGKTTSRYYVGSDYRGMIGSYLLGFGNDNLSWQKTRKSNFGVDLTVANKLNISANYYVETTQGSIGMVSTAPSTGFPEYAENIGDLKTTGWELYGTYTIFSSADRRRNWSVFANLFSVKNKISRISNTLEALNAVADTTFSSTPITRYAVGQPTTALWAVRSLGIDPASGYEIFQKRDGTVTNIYDPRDQVVIADSRPELEGTFGTNFEYKGVGANVFFRFRLGGHAYNQTLVDRVENASVNLYNVDSRVAEERWLQPGDHTFFKGLIDYSGRAINTLTYNSSRFVQRDNLLSLESLSVYYRFNDSLNERWGLSNTRVTVFGNELYQWSSIRRERGLDYPFARSFTLQVSTSF